MGNQRQGTHKTKNRSEVSGGGKKPWKQKGTGRARQGSNTAPQWVRGGKAHGPLPHLYKRDINKKVKRRSLLSALTVKANESSVYVIEKLALAAPKTKDLVKLLAAAKLDGKKNLIVVESADQNLLLAARNLPTVLVQGVWDLNTYNLLNADNVIFTDAAVKALAASAQSDAAAKSEKTAKAEKTAKPAKAAPAKAAGSKA
jgi:large subunit ribosomal protein L4